MVRTESLLYVTVVTVFYCINCVQAIYKLGNPFVCIVGVGPIEKLGSKLIRRLCQFPLVVVKPMFWQRKEINHITYCEKITYKSKIEIKLIDEKHKLSQNIL